MHHKTKEAIEERLFWFGSKLETVHEIFDVGYDMDLTLDDAGEYSRELSNLVVKAKAQKSMVRWKKAVKEFGNIRVEIDKIRDRLAALVDDCNEIEVKG